MITFSDINLAVKALKDGKILIYPTESMFGIGCDPFNQEAVTKLLTIKQRTEEQGLILIAANWDSVEKLILPISDDIYKSVNDSWPGNTTWLFEKSSIVPKWICGQHTTVAVRIPNHKVCLELCNLFDGPIVSTSANIHGKSPCKTKESVIEQFGSLEESVYLLGCEVGKYTNHSEIHDISTMKIIRK